MQRDIVVALQECYLPVIYKRHVCCRNPVLREVFLLGLHQPNLHVLLQLFAPEGVLQHDVADVSVGKLEVGCEEDALAHGHLGGDVKRKLRIAVVHAGVRCHVHVGQRGVVCYGFAALGSGSRAGGILRGDVV